ncbi:MULTISPECIES: ATP-binding protein [unclassified Streptomyces]|uniref:ATP-binding protein n=1 Tax=unclassified Streptomyces TaxID=2593676 RepID=UPI001D051A56|nr:MULTISPECIES: ATP-binding protein [unclassified Streptomyces]
MWWGSRMVRERAGGAAGAGRRIVVRREFGGGDLPGLRLLADGCAALAGLAGPRRGDFVVAVDAVAGNAVRHGGGRGVLVLSRTPEELECQVTDRGPGFAEDAVPPPGPGGGCGLWVARLVSDRLTVACGPTGSAVTLAMRLSGDPAPVAHGRGSPG